MGKSNVRTKRYIGNNEKFADLCNYVLFQGESVIKPEDLKEKDVTELGVPYTEKGYMALEKIRDLLKSCTVKSAAGVTYLVVGIENQTDIHYAMTIRNMLMDALNYAAQTDAYAKKHRKEKDLKGDEFLSGFAKEDKLQPVITITVYWNSGAWDGPKSLHEMLDVPEKRLFRFISDYRMNLVVPDEIEDFAKFKTELGVVFELCQYANDKKKLDAFLTSKKEQGLYLEREAVEMLNECVNVGIKVSKKERVINVCKAIEEMKRESLAKGLEQGGLHMLVQLVKNGILTTQVAAEQANMQVEEFQTLLKVE